MILSFFSPRRSDEPRLGLLHLDSWSHAGFQTLSIFPRDNDKLGSRHSFSRLRKHQDSNLPGASDWSHRPFPALSLAKILSPQPQDIICNFSRLRSPLDLFSTFPTTFWLFPKFLCRSVIFYPHQGNLNNNFESFILKCKAWIPAALTWWADIRGGGRTVITEYKAQAPRRETRVSHMPDLIWSSVAQHKVRKLEFHTLWHSSNIFQMIKCDILFV